MKAKKTLLLGSMLAAIGAPIAAVISCGGSSISRYDADNDGKLSIAATFSATGTQTKALKTIIAKYNAYVDSLSRAEQAKGYMKINPLVTVSGGYNKAADQLKIKFAAQDKKTLYNLVVDYPSAVAIIKSYDMQLDLKDVLSDADFKALKARFEPKYWSQNDKIGGIKAGGGYAIPVSVSTMANAINTPMLAYVISQINKNYPGAIDLSANPHLKRLYDKGQQSSDDILKIQALWGEMVKSKVTFNNGEITDTIFTEFDTLIKFVIKAQQAFGKAVDAPEQLHLLALDSPTNIIQMLSYAYANGDMSKFYITKAEDGYVKYIFLKDKASDSYKNFEKGIELLRQGVAAGAIWIGGGGAYGSSLLINHQAMMSLGSSAGATHWYTSGRDMTIVKNHASSKIEGEIAVNLFIDGLQLAYAKTSFKISGKEQQFHLYGSSASLDASNVKLKEHYTKSHLLTDLSSFPILVKVVEANHGAFEALGSPGTNFQAIGTMPGQSNAKVYLITENHHNNIKSSNSDKYDVVAAAQSGIEGISTIITKEGDAYTHQGTYFGFGQYKNKIYEAKDKSEAKKYDLVLKKGLTITQLLNKFKNDEFKYLASISKDDVSSFTTQSGNDAEMIGTKKDGTEFYILKVSQIEVKTNAQTLQATEVEGVPSPTKVQGQPKGGVYLQGPSFIPVHANDAEDKAIALFIQWFVGNSYKTNWHDTTNNKYVSSDQLIPSQYWLEKANYVVPIVGAFNSGSPTDEIIKRGLASGGRKYWIGVKIAWDTFHKAKIDANINPIIQPVDAYSSSARNDVTDVVIKKIYTSAHTSGITKSFEAIYKSMHTLAKSNNII